MTHLADLFPGQRLAPMGVACTIHRAPGSAAATLDVTWVAPSDGTAPPEDAYEKDCRWVRRGSTLPAEGDEGLLLIDSRGDPWVIAW